MNLHRLHLLDDIDLLQLPLSLVDGGLTDTLYQLLLSGRLWMDEKYERFGTDLPFLADLKLAISTLRPPLSKADLVILAQLHTAQQIVHSRAGARDNLDIETLMRLGNSREALACAEFREQGVERFEGFLAALRGQKETSDPSLLLRLREECDLVPDKWTRMKCRLDLARELVRMKYIEQGAELLSLAAEDAEYFAERCDQRYTSTNYDLTITSWNEETGEPSPLNNMPILNVAGNEDPLSKLLVDVAQIQADIDLTIEARRLCDKLKDPAARVRLMCHLAERLGAEAGQALFQEAINITEVLRDPGAKAYALLMLVKSFRNRDLPVEEAKILAEANKALTEFEELGIAAAKLSGGFQVGRSAGNDRVNAVSCCWSIRNIAVILGREGLDAEPALGSLRRIVATFKESLTDEMLAEIHMLGEQPLLYREISVDNSVLSIEALLGRPADAENALADALASLGLLAEALAVATSIQHDFVGPTALLAVARGLVSAGRLDDALEVAQNIPRLPLVEEDRELRIMHTTHYMSEKKAFKVSRLDARSYIIFLVAEAFAQKGQSDEACALAGSLDSIARLEIIRMIANRLSRQRHAAAEKIFLMSQELSQEHANRDGRDAALYRMLGKLSQSHLPLAKRLPQVFDSVSLRFAAYKLIAEASARLQDFESGWEAFDMARSEVSKEKDSMRKGLAFCELSELSLTLGFPDVAMEDALTAMKLSEDTKLAERAYLLCKIAETSIKIGAADAANVAYDAAISSAEEIFPRFAAIPLLGLIARSCDQSGLKERAELIFEHTLRSLAMRYPNAHASDSSIIVRYLVEAGRFEQAIGLALRISDDPRYPELLSRTLGLIAVGLAQAERYEDTISIILALTDPFDVVPVLSKISEILFQRHRPESAMSVLELATHLSERVADRGGAQDLWPYVIEAFAASQNFNRACELASRIAARSRKAEALLQVSRHQALAGSFVRALDTVGPTPLDKFLEHLAEVSHGLEEHEPDLDAQILREATRIVAWVRSDWAAISELIGGS